MARKTWLGTVSGDYSVAGNFAEGSIPQDADDVYLAPGAVAISAGLDQGAVKLASFHQSQAYTGLVGTAAAYLKINAARVILGEYFGTDQPPGSQRIKLHIVHASGVSPIVEVLDSASASADANLPPIRLLMEDQSGELHVRKGQVGLAVGLPSEISTVGAIQVSYQTSTEGDAQVLLGPGVTWASLTTKGGRTVLQSGGTTILQKDGVVHMVGGGTVTTWTIEGGTAYPEATGTITTLECKGGTADFARSRLARTVTTPKVWVGAVLRYDPAIVQMTAPPAPQEEMALAAQAA